MIGPPLGAHWDGAATTFAVYSSVAEAIDVCLFGADGSEQRVALDERDGHTHWRTVGGVGPGQRYGFRVHGPRPCDAAKLLVDPYARAIEGEVTWRPAVREPHRDSAPYVPRSVVCPSTFDWGDERPPRVPLADSLIYELHVKGFTATHPSVPPELQGTYAGLAHPAVIEHLVRLGVTAVELLPVHQFVHDERLVALGLRNYWGYNTLGFFAPHNGYAASGQCGQQVVEFKQLVAAMHRAGIEVILDVVYNHTAEGDATGPTLCFRGFDEAAYYVLAGHDYVNDTGCGNTTNADHPAFVRLVLDSLRHWVKEYRVDGFRFDLATVLGREGHGRHFDAGAALFDAIYADPTLAGVKLIAEPWDLGPGGYQVGQFPVGWQEWNGRFRDSVRDFWRGHPGEIGRFAAALTGSAELFARPGRRPQASVNFVTCHDGFTLADLVSYERKHNEANGEANHDGTEDNRSWNCGVEGPTDVGAVRRLRARQQRNFLVSLLLANGVPMLTAGDEQGRSQGGNNNAYCQDGDLSYLDWEQVDVALRSFTRWLVEFRRSQPVFRRHTWTTGNPRPDGVTDVAWFTPEGTIMTAADWEQGYARSVAMLADGRVAGVRGADSVFIVWNAHDGRLLYRLPDHIPGAVWRRVLDTNEPLPAERLRRYVAGDRVRVEAHSTVILVAPGHDEPPNGVPHRAVRH